MKKILIFIAFKDFKDEEYFVPKRILEKAGFSVKTVSTQKGIARGVEGGEVKVDLTLEEVEDFVALVFVGGPGCLKELDQEKTYQIIRKAQEEEKIIGAICIAPLILAKAGILKEKEATVWSSSMDKSAIDVLKENGAVYESEFSVVQDNNIITAPGPAAAKDFGKTLANVLC